MGERPCGRIHPHPVLPHPNNRCSTFRDGRHRLMTHGRTRAKHQHAQRRRRKPHNPLGIRNSDGIIFLTDDASLKICKRYPVLHTRKLNNIRRRRGLARYRWRLGNLSTIAHHSHPYGLAMVNNPQPKPFARPMPHTSAFRNSSASEISRRPS